MPAVRATHGLPAPPSEAAAISASSISAGNSFPAASTAVFFISRARSSLKKAASGRARRRPVAVAAGRAGFADLRGRARVDEVGGAVLLQFPADRRVQVELRLRAGRGEQQALAQAAELLGRLFAVILFLSSFS